MKRRARRRSALIILSFFLPFFLSFLTSEERHGISEAGGRARARCSGVPQLSVYKVQHGGHLYSRYSRLNNRVDKGDRER